MHQHLALKRPLVVIRHDDARRQALPVQRDAVDQVELVRPRLARRGVEPLGRRAQPKVELDGEVRRARGGGRLARRLAEELPPRRPREAVLRELRGCGVVGGRAEDLFSCQSWTSSLDSFPSSIEGKGLLEKPTAPLP